MKFYLFIICMVCINSTILPAQNRCGTSELEGQKHQTNPALKQQKKAFENELQSFIHHKRQAKKTIQNEIITIPIVFHVLYQNQAENVEIEKLTSQVDVLNQDFRRKNTDTTNVWQQAADAKIRFCLSNKDINGNYFNGVTRTQTNIDVFEYQKDSIFLTAKGGKDIWPGYLNIYVCDLGVPTTSVGGYSSLPGYEAYIDGIVLDYRVTGLFGAIFSFNFAAGRTCTHEVGHWLNLEHMWGPNTENFSCSDLDDGVADTPISLKPYTECNTGSTCGSVDMAENFMDYHFDYCMNLFTQGQVERMHMSIELAPSRKFLLNNTCLENCTRINLNKKYPIHSDIEQVLAIDTVYAINSIANNAEVSYQAGQVIILETDFSVDASSNFMADIQACVVD